MSDHAPVSLKIKLGKGEQCRKRWRFQTFLLQDATFVQFIEQCIDIYFKHNGEETSACTRWEAFKAYIRGEIISYSSTQNKKRTLDILSMEEQIKTLENEFYDSKNPEKLCDLTLMRAKYDKLITDKVAKQLNIKH